MQCRVKQLARVKAATFNCPPIAIPKTLVKPDLYIKIILTAIAACLAFLAYKVATLPFFVQPKVAATQPAATEAAPGSKQAAPAEQVTAPAPKLELPVPPPPPPEPPPMPPAKAALTPEKLEPPQAIAQRPKVARLDVVGKQVQEKKLADAQAERKLQEEDAVTKAEQERLKREKDAVAALADQDKKQAERLAQEAEAAVRKQKEKDEAEGAHKQKEKDDAEAARKQKEKDEAEAARKAKEKEEAAQKERERQRKEAEDRIRKIAKESEIKEQIDDLKKRIVKNADFEVAAVNTAHYLVTKMSDTYAASIQAAIRPNITFNPDSISGNPSVDIEVGLKLDGSIRSRTITRSSGIAAWDAAAVTALDKTESLPLDERGRAPPTLIITLRPRER